MDIHSLIPSLTSLFDTMRHKSRSDESLPNPFNDDPITYNPHTARRSRRDNERQQQATIINTHLERSCKSRPRANPAIAIFSIANSPIATCSYDDARSVHSTAIANTSHHRTRKRTTSIFDTSNFAVIDDVRGEEQRFSTDRGSSFCNVKQSIDAPSGAAAWRRPAGPGFNRVSARPNHA